MPPVTTNIGPCDCCGGGDRCCIFDPFTGASPKPNIFLTMMTANCLDLDGVSIPMRMLTACNHGGWVANGNDFSPNGWGQNYYKFHEKTVGGTTYEYAIQPTLCVCDDALGPALCPAGSFLFRGLLSLWRGIKNTPKDFLTLCQQTSFFVDAVAPVVASDPPQYCASCSSPLNLIGTFVPFSGIATIGVNCPEDDFCNLTFRGAFTE